MRDEIRCTRAETPPTTVDSLVRAVLGHGEPDWNWVARACAASPYSLEELQRILYDEVHPVVHLNLWAVAGVWTGFDEEWLVSSILSRRRRPLLRLPWPEARRYPWRQLAPLITAE